MCVGIESNRIESLIESGIKPSGETGIRLPFRYPWGVRDCLVCTKTVSVTTFPTTMAKVRLTMNTTARRRLRKPQQHTLQSGASDWAESGPAWVTALRFSGDSVAGSSIVELLHALMFDSGAAMARDCCVDDDNDDVLTLWDRSGENVREGEPILQDREGARHKTSNVNKNKWVKTQLCWNDVEVPRPPGNLGTVTIVTSSRI